MYQITYEIIFNYFQQFLKLSIMTDLSTKQLDITPHHHKIRSVKYKNTNDLIQTWKTRTNITAQTVESKMFLIA